ncbi:IS3 family transposase [Staphylococcus pseudintermedius]|uniref:IS3 family transposase n=1 Tax=Staphylococcus pseudintermedius TaxID=283734 RepID=UPI0037DAB84F|nr:IS3 family transposase [Staphylococcus pseudintermedius]MCE5598804.1 IS3 family transposase [Staphylococcus pseudintermedius]MCE5692611.1 IS3 family transposase [Staphylococcus pseudintermedius]
MTFGFSILMMGELSASSYIAIRLKEIFNPIHFAYLNIDGVKMFSILMIVNTVIVISCTYIISKWSMSYNQKYIFLLGMVMYVVGYANVTHSKHHLPIYPNLLNQQFKVSQLGSVWGTDITYVYTKEGWFYLATVMDLFSRRIIGWAMAPRMTKALVISALNKAYTIQEPREGLIHHSDQGSQYASIEYQNLLREKGIQSSMSRKGNCYDNACIASFHSIIKKELIHHQNYKTRNEAMFNIMEYILNAKSVHSTLNNMSSIEFEKKYTTKSPSSECTF